MRSLRVPRRFTLWLASLALVFAALAPAVSHALALVSGSTAWVEVCTAQGSRWVQLDEAASPDEAPTDATAAQLDHCPYCHLSQQGMAPAPLTVPLATALHDGLPERFFTAPRTAHAWCSAQPRAPPFVS